MSHNTGSNVPHYHGRLDMPRFGYRPNGTWGQLYIGFGLPSRPWPAKEEESFQAEVERANREWEAEQAEMEIVR